MNSKFKIQNSKVLWLFICAFFLGQTGCGSIYIPNLEEVQCTESREVVKKFYSFHFGHEMKFSTENLKMREKFLTPGLVKELQNLQTENDVFTTGSADIPRTFRLGSCQVLEPTRTKVEVLLFWRDESQTKQQSIQTEVLKQENNWLINKILR